MLKKPSFRSHPTALIESTDIGEATRIWAHVHVLDGARIGKNCNIGDGCYIEGGAVLGDNVTVKNGNSIWEGVSIADNVFVGPSVVFTNDLYPRSPRMEAAAKRYQTKEWCEKTIVEEGATLGANSTIICGRRIGEYSMVGAGAVVTKDVLPHTLVVGNPARVKGFVCRCGLPLIVKGKNAKCRSCHAQYSKKGSVIKIK